MTQPDNVMIVQSMYAAVGRGDIEAILALMDEDVHWIMPGPPAIPFAGVRRGRQGVEDFFRILAQSLEILSFEPRQFIAQGDAVVVMGAERSRAKPTGRQYGQEWAHYYRLRNARIAECRIIENTAVMAAAFAAAPAAA
ncbi:MAG: nuclear transport factor 2 family protein [Burkholderiales bacterium]|nr:nuclear transport factor 2 family protein [Burkholderiales bacterium]